MDQLFAGLMRSATGFGAAANPQPNFGFGATGPQSQQHEMPISPQTLMNLFSVTGAALTELGSSKAFSESFTNMATQEQRGDPFVSRPLYGTVETFPARCPNRGDDVDIANAKKDAVVTNEELAPGETPHSFFLYQQAPRKVVQTKDEIMASANAASESFDRINADGKPNIQLKEPQPAKPVIEKKEEPKGCVGQRGYSGTKGSTGSRTDDSIPSLFDRSHIKTLPFNVDFLNSISKDPIQLKVSMKDLYIKKGAAELIMTGIPQPYTAEMIVSALTNTKSSCDRLLCRELGYKEKFYIFGVAIHQGDYICRMIHVSKDGVVSTFDVNALRFLTPRHMTEKYLDECLIMLNFGGAIAKTEIEFLNALPCGKKVYEDRELGIKKRGNAPILVTGKGTTINTLEFSQIAGFLTHSDLEVFIFGKDVPW